MAGLLAAEAPVLRNEALALLCCEARHVAGLVLWGHLGLLVVVPVRVGLALAALLAVSAVIAKGVSPRG